jgi:hypothetical protein
MATTPAIRIRIAKTVNVYGRLSARATIHMVRLGSEKRRHPDGVTVPLPGAAVNRQIGQLFNPSLVSFGFVSD